MAYTDVEELDLVGPYEVFGKLGELGENVSLNIVSRNPTVRCSHDLLIVRTKMLRDRPGEILVVPGGKGARTKSEERTSIAEYIASSYSSREYVLSVCTGTFLLEEAGIFSGRTVTTHRGYLSQIKLHAVDHRIVKDGNLITCQGVTSGIDGSLFLVLLLYGKEKAERIAQRIEYLPSVEALLPMTHIC